MRARWDREDRHRSHHGRAAVHGEGPGRSPAPSRELTDNGYDYSFGGGLRAGIEWEAMPVLRFGVSGQTKMYMTKFDKYAGLFAEQGGSTFPQR
jgi:long-chain fatty acid transport protein